MSKNKSKKMDKTIVVALIGLAGTVLASLIASPFINRLFQATPAPQGAEEPEAALNRVFWEDFEKGYQSGLSISTEEWQVMKYGDGSVLEVSGTDSGNTSISFGPNDFSDGTIAFRLLFVNFNGFVLNFRGGAETYTLYLAPTGGEITLGYGSAANDWELEPFDGGARAMDFSENAWYDIKLEADDSRFTLWVEDQKLLAVEDSRLKQGETEFAIQYDGTALLDDIAVYQANH